MCIEVTCELKDGLVLLLAGSPLLIIGLSSMIGMIWKRRRRKAVDEQKVENKAPTTLTTNKGDFNAAVDSIIGLEDIDTVLQQDLRKTICGKLASLKEDIRLRQMERKRRIHLSNKAKEADLQALQTEHQRQLDLLNTKYQQIEDNIQIEYAAEVRKLEDSIRNLKVVLLEGGEAELEACLEAGRRELECPVCMEEMRPPRRIWQCSDGHPVCGNCRKKPQVTCCPSCRKYLVGRSTIAEKLARAVFGEEEGGEKHKITLTGYREFKPSAHPSHDIKDEQ